MSAQSSVPELVADVIYAAATDDSDQFRFEAGADAMHMLAARRAAYDASFFAGLKKQFGLA